VQKAPGWLAQQRPPLPQVSPLQHLSLAPQVWPEVRQHCQALLEEGPQRNPVQQWLSELHASLPWWHGPQMPL
jgi:hypothetical protein